MKRSEIIGLINSVGHLMDAFDHIEIKDKDDEEVIGAISKDVIHGMQVALCVCSKLLDGTHSEDNPVRLASELIHSYAVVEFDLPISGYAGTEYHVEDRSDAND